MSLLNKLLQVAKSVPEITKTGYNSFHDYKYVTEEDIVKPIRDLLYKNNVLLFTSVDDVKQENELTTLIMTFTFQDVDSGESMSFKWVGQGADKGDKGVYKAQTGALKYFLLKTFLIPTATDPENSKLEDNSKYDEPATDNQKTYVKKLVAQHATQVGKTVQEVEKAMDIDYNKLTKQQASEIIEKLRVKK